MAITRDVKGLIDKGDYASIEEEWLARMGENPTDLDTFVGIARALVGSGQERRARTLLELLDEELRGKELWAPRLGLLRRAGHILLDAGTLHPAIMATLRKIHSGKPSFAGFIDKVGLERAPDDIPKTWEKVERLEMLLGLDVGAVVEVEGKGAGRVRDVNLDLEAFKVEIAHGPTLTIGFRGAGKLLKLLPDGSFLRRKVEEPDELAKLRTADPPELLRLVLESIGKPATAGEIKAALSGLVSESQWTAWWAAARKHPQVVTGSTGRQTYSWAASSGAAQDALVAAFDKADARGKMDILRRPGAREDAARERFTRGLVAAGEAAAASDPGLAFEIWFALERYGGVPANLAWEPDRLLAQPTGWRKLIAGISDRLLRERAYAMIRERNAEWHDLFADGLLREDDPRTLDFLATALQHERPELLERAWDTLVSQPRKAPAGFIWLVERAAVDETLRARNPLRLMQQILAGLTIDELATYRVRLRAQCESGGALPRTLSLLREDQAPAAVEAIQKASGIESYQRDALLNAIELRFPALRQETGKPLYALPASIATKREELRQMKEVEIPANRKAIEEARALGDLRENFEYKSARQRHEYLASRVAALHRDLERAQPIQPLAAPVEDVRIGSRVMLAGEHGTRALTILGPWESKPEVGIVSYESDLAQALLGRKRGEAVRVGESDYKVGEITPAEL